MFKKKVDRDIYGHPGCDPNIYITALIYIEIL
jgi:hypothetical protein